MYHDPGWGHVKAGLVGALVTAVVMLSLPVVAAVGSNLILGQANTADAVTYLSGAAATNLRIINSQTGSPALDLRVESGAPPLKVNSGAWVRLLNADLLDGKHASAFALAGPLRICEVTDTGGIDDEGFNETTWNGIKQARTLLGILATYRESASEAAFRPNIDALVALGCDVVITVGWWLAPDTAGAACDNPGQWFATVDQSVGPWPPWADDYGNPLCDYGNVRGLTFAVGEAAFLAGYLAAGMTETGTVATYGAFPILPATIFMDGFVYGVRHYNQVKGANVQVLGWDPDTQDGLFTNDWANPEAGKAMGRTLNNGGADIILPVAGATGLGTAAVAQQRGFLVIGVDTDQYLTAPEYGPAWLTSVLKKMDAAAYDTAQSAVLGSLSDAPYVGTLANGGVGLAPYHGNAPAVPLWLRNEMRRLQADIISGAVSVTG